MADIIMTLGILFIPLLGLRAVIHLVRSWMVNRTIKLAIDKRPEDLPMLLEKLAAISGGWRQDIAGWVALALGLALAAGGLLEEGSGRLITIQFALLPMFVGAALLIHHHFPRSRDS